MPSFFGVDRRSKCGILICKAACRLTRTIFYLRCAIYCCLLPRTHPQQHQLWAQTHSRRQHYARSDNKNCSTVSPCMSAFTDLFLHFYTSIQCNILFFVLNDLLSYTYNLTVNIFLWKENHCPKMDIYYPAKVISVILIYDEYQFNLTVVSNSSRTHVKSGAWFWSA